MKPFSIAMVLALLIGVVTLQSVDWYLNYTQDLVEAQGEAEYWKQQTEALVSRGRWICDMKQRPGQCTYRFVPNAKPTFKTAGKVVSR
jgi:hypothetical protein